MKRLLLSLGLALLSLSPTTAITLDEARLSAAEAAMNSDNLARFVNSLMKTYQQSNWAYDDATFGLGPSATTNMATDLSFGPSDWGSLSFMFGLTVYMLDFRQDYFYDLGGFVLNKKDTLGLNLFSGANLYGPDWKVFAGLNIPMTQHMDINSGIFTPYLFTNFSLFDHLIKPYFEAAIPSNFSSLFNRLAFGAITPFGTPGFRTLKTIGGDNYTLSYRWVLPFNLNTGLRFDGSAIEGLKAELFLARSFDVVGNENFFTALSAWDAQIIMATLFVPSGEADYPGRLFFTVSYTGKDGYGFQTGLDSKPFALILSWNTFLEGYYGTTLGKLALYFKLGFQFGEDGSLL